MKILSLLVVILTVFAARVHANDLQYMRIGWPQGYFSHVPPKMEAYDQGDDMALTYWGEKPADLRLMDVGEDFLSQLDSGPFAIVGRYECSKIVPGSTLDMLCYFRPQKSGDRDLVYSSTTPLVEETGTRANISLSQTFVLPFDATATKTHLVKIEWKLHLAGGYGSRLHFDQVYLRQCPGGQFPTTASSSGTTKPLPDTLPTTLPATIPSLQPMFQVAAPAPPPIASDAPAIHVIADLPIEKYLASEQDQKDLLENSSGHNAAADQAHISVVKEADGTSELFLARTGTFGDCRTALLTVPQSLVSQISGTRYGITGEVSYALADRGALCMESVFSQTGLNAPLDRWYQELDGPSWGAQGDNMGLMEDNRDWGKFYLGFDRRWADRRPNAELTFKRIIFNVVLGGPGTVHLRNLKLVQYPEPPREPTAQMAPTSPATASAINPARIDWKSFLLGVATTCLALLAVTGLIFVSRLWQRRHHERELRRIASLDS